MIFESSAMWKGRSDGEGYIGQLWHCTDGTVRHQSKVLFREADWLELNVQSAPTQKDWLGLAVNNSTGALKSFDGEGGIQGDGTVNHKFSRGTGVLVAGGSLALYGKKWQVLEMQATLLYADAQFKAIQVMEL